MLANSRLALPRPARRRPFEVGARARHGRAERRLRDVEAVARFGSWEFDLATRTVTVSPELRRIIGGGDVDLACIIERVHPDDAAKVKEWLARSAARHPPAGCFFRLMRDDGSLGTFYGRSELRPAHRGSPARICGTVQDVTDQVAAERAINEAAHLYRDIFENCAWGVFQTTADGRYLTANPALARIYGYDSPSELLTRLTNIGGQLYIEPGRRDEFVHAMREQGAVRGFESQVWRRDGTVIWIAETCREVRTSTGHLLYYEGTVEDISERKANEAELVRAHAVAEAANATVQAVNRDLERRVAERTAELSAIQDELLKKERLSTLGKLTATVAHELRNPLSAIRNTLHVIRDMPDTENERHDRALSRIERSIARCEVFVADLIDFAHAHRLDRRAIALDKWLDAVLAEHAFPDGVTPEWRLAATGAVVHIDQGRLKRAITNIVDNAVQAVADHPGERRVALATEAGDTVRIIVTDSGPGIAPDILPKIFDPLFSTKSFGTGLGLPTAKQIIEQHGGAIAVESVLARGTRVEITLPRAADRPRRVIT